MTVTLDTLRDQIDAIDAHILDLLSRRGAIAQAVGQVKAESGAPVYRPEREARVLRGVVERNPGPLHDRDLQTIFREIMSSCRALERRLTVAYPGAAGTLGRQALFQQFGSAVKSLPCASVGDVFHAVEGGSADYGIAPFENQAEGVNLRTLDLLLVTPAVMTGEVWTPVHYGLMSGTGSMEGVSVVCADAQTLRHCQAWLGLDYPGIEQRAVDSGAEAAMLASWNPGVAAIAGATSAEQYGLRIVRMQVHDDPYYLARFVVIGDQASGRSGVDRTSLVLAVPDQADAVQSRLLFQSVLARCGVPVTRLETRPARTGPWPYYVYIDIDGHAADAPVRDALGALRRHAGFVKILGSYPASL